MDALLEKEAKVTAQGQTTVPAEIRKALGIAPGDRITFAVDRAGTVTLRRADEHDDPALVSFLDLIGRDIAERADSLHPATEDMEAELRALVEGVDWEDDN